nr:hypothetical protein [Neorhizobium tomejilense]
MIQKSTPPTQDVAPTSFPDVTPRQVQHGHDFQLQIIMEMQKSIGELAAKTDRLITDVKSQGEKVDALRMRFALIAGGTAVVGFILATVLAVLRFVPASWFGNQ